MSNKAKTCGIVVFYETHYQDKRLVKLEEINRTPILSYFDALTVYAETPNPASQLIAFNTEREMTRELEELEQRIKDPAWLKELSEVL